MSPQFQKRKDRPRRRPQQGRPKPTTATEATQTSRGQKPKKKPAPPTRSSKKAISPVAEWSPSPPKSYAILFFDSFPAAKTAGEQIQAACARCDQLNVVIRAEGNMDDAELLDLDPKVKVFAGEAWNTIHERRVGDGWYEEAH